MYRFFLRGTQAPVQRFARAPAFLFPGNARFLSFGNFHDAFTTMRQGNSEFRTGNYSKAIQSYNEVISMTPEDPKPYYNKGCALQSQGHYDYAISAFVRALELDTTLVPAKLNMGTCLVSMGRFQQATTYFQSILDVYPEAAHGNLGHCHLQLGAIDLAIYHLDKAIEKNASNPEFHFDKTQALFLKEDYDAALISIDAALEIDKMPNYFYWKSKILEKLGKSAEEVNHTSKHFIAAVFSNKF